MTYIKKKQIVTHFRQYISPYTNGNVWIDRNYYYPTKFGFSSWWVD